MSPDDSPADAETTAAGEAGADDEGSSDPSPDRDVVVPLRLYKTVTVFSTLIAILCVVGGFLLLDAATLRASLLRQVVESLLAALGVEPAPSVLSAAFAVAGLVVVGLGAAIYVFGTRFRAPGMAGDASEREE